jgi:hypothetical protein
VIFAKSVKLTELTYFEYMNMPADHYWLLMNAGAAWDEGRRDERELRSKLAQLNGPS